MFAVPCAQLTHCFLDGEFSRIHHKRHPGWSRVYARVLAEGAVKQGDAVLLEQAEGGTDRP